MKTLTKPEHCDDRLMNTADLQFHIIYTPDTVEQLAPFISSLLKFSDCRYQLSSNGCPPAEAAALRNFCGQHSRLSYRQLSADVVLDHGSALDLLHDDCSDEWFCFMDSDILATGSFAKTLQHHLDDCDVFSSGQPLWHAPEDIFLPPHFRRWQGSYGATTDNITLGFTYFAVYRNAELAKVRAATEVGFGYCYWDNISPVHQAMLQRIGLDKIDYDTGKLLMALMHAAGLRLRTAEIDTLVHLGGVSALAGDSPDYYYRGRLDRLACTLLDGALAKPLFFAADFWHGLALPSPGLSATQSAQLTVGERRVMQSRRRKRINTARYFTALMHSLKHGTNQPQIPRLGFQPAEARIAAASKHVSRLFGEQIACAESVEQVMAGPGRAHA